MYQGLPMLQNKNYKKGYNLEEGWCCDDCIIFQNKFNFPKEINFSSQENSTISKVSHPNYKLYIGEIYCHECDIMTSRLPHSDIFNEPPGTYIKSNIHYSLDIWYCGKCTNKIGNSYSYQIGNFHSVDSTVITN
jgi:hypothetical protein